MPTFHLTNIIIKKLTDRNANPYYLIINQDNQEAYFCFEGTVNKENWQELENNWEGIKEIEIEYVERISGLQTFRRVINFQVSNFKEVWEVF